MLIGSESNQIMGLPKFREGERYPEGAVSIAGGAPSPGTAGRNQEV